MIGLRSNSGAEDVVSECSAFQLKPGGVSSVAYEGGKAATSCVTGVGTVKLTRTGPDYPSMSGSHCVSAGTRHVVPHQEGAGS
jgi:hypothetical protein